MKRVILTILLTVICLAFTKNLYLSRVIDVQFDARVSNSTEFAVYYQSEKNVPFNGKNVVRKKIDILPPPVDSFQKVKIQIPERTIQRFRLDFGSKPQEVTIQNLKIKGTKKLAIGDYSQFHYNQIDTKILEHNQLTVKSNQGDPYIVYKPAFYMKGLYRFNWKIFTILSMALFLFFFKMVQYLALFKMTQNQSRIDIVFVGVFFALLFIPMLHINTADKSTRENRMLAKYVPLFQNGKINNAYGKNFETWFNDRFFGRDKVIKRYGKLQDLFRDGNKNVLVGEDNWLFYKGDNSIVNFRNATLYTDSELKQITQYLSNIQDWCEKNNKKFVFFIAPDKHRIYGEFYPSYIIKERPDSESKTQQLLTYLNKNTNIRVLYPINELKQHKENLIYYKHDTHWTEMGSYIGYTEIMKNLGEEPIILNERTSQVRSTYDLSHMYPEVDEEDETDYIIPKLNIQYKCTPTHDFANRIDKTCLNAEKTQSVILFHDSFSRAMLPYFTNSFNTVSTRWRRNMTKDDLIYMKENADIVILEVVERYVPLLADLSFPKE